MNKENSTLNVTLTATELPKEDKAVKETIELPKTKPRDYLSIYDDFLDNPCLKTMEVLVDEGLKITDQNNAESFLYIINNIRKAISAKKFMSILNKVSIDKRKMLAQKFVPIFMILNMKGSFNPFDNVQFQEVRFK